MKHKQFLSIIITAIIALTSVIPNFTATAIYDDFQTIEEAPVSFSVESEDIDTSTAKKSQEYLAYTTTTAKKSTTTTTTTRVSTTTSATEKYIVSSEYLAVSQSRPTCTVKTVTATKQAEFEAYDTSFDLSEMNLTVDYTMSCYTGGDDIRYYWSDGSYTYESLPFKLQQDNYNKTISLDEVDNLKLSYSSPAEAYKALCPDGDKDITFDLKYSCTARLDYPDNPNSYIYPGPFEAYCSGTIPVKICATRYGDVNFDGKVTAQDAGLVLQAFVSGSSSGLTNSQKIVADVNKDGRIDALDASSILYHYHQAAIGKTPSFLSNGNSSSSSNNGYSDDEIANAPNKAKMTVPTVEAEPGSEVTIPIKVTADSWCASGIHVEYSPYYLELVDASWSDDVKSSALGGGNIKKNTDNVFFTTAGVENVNISEYAYLTFKVKNSTNVGYFLPISIKYHTGDLFTTCENDKSDKLMQAYLFTQGITNGGIKVVSPEPTTPPATTPVDPTIIPSSLTMNPGDTGTLLTINIPEGQTVSWTSDNTKVASVKNGVVTAIGEGTATIYAICGNNVMTCTVRVSDSSVAYGDANGDGKLSIADAVQILTYASNPAKNPLDDPNCCDVYNRGDGVDVMDSLSVQKKLTNVISALPESYI